MKKITQTPQRAKRGSKVDNLRFNAPAARFKSTAFWPFPKPKTPEQWWWLFTIGAISVSFLYIVFFSIITQP